MQSENNVSNVPSQMRRSVFGVLVFTVFLATLATFFGARHYFERLEQQAASNRLVLYLRSLNDTLEQHQHLPFILARDPQYSKALDLQSAPSDINEKLKSLATEAKLEAIYVMNEEGLVLASSNAGERNSFLGQNYGFRPYFREALGGKRSDYFAIGATSGRPGYFVAEPVAIGNESLKGVIAIKLDVSELQRSWETDRDTVVAINKDNIVVLASNPDWLYRPISDLSKEVRQTILESRQFGIKPLEPLDWTPQSEPYALIEGTRYLLASGSSEWRDWTVHYLQPENAILRQTLLATAFFGSIIAVLVGFATYLRSRRIELAYTASERQRRELIESNSQLEQAQTELARTAKLAALGHLAASLTHELGQPISAFRNHLAAAEMSNEISSPETLSNLNKLVARMEGITGQFRFFARGSGPKKTRVSLTTVLNEVENLLKPDIINANVNLVTNDDIPALDVLGHQIQLEQAFTNLLRNAVQAVEDTIEPEVRINVIDKHGVAEIRVSDNGPGLAGASLTDLQEPFFSTKPSGVGMGLGLAIATEIIKDHGGELTLGATEVGAEFVVALPIWREGDPI